MTKLVEAFKALEALNEDKFDINSDDVEELKDFLDGDTEFEVGETVFDVDADTEEELKDSYVDDVVLECVVCKSKLFKNTADVVLPEEDDTLEEGLEETDIIVNAGEECPYCHSVDGYHILGQVAPYEPETEVEKVEVDGEEVDDDIVEIEEKEEELKESKMRRCIGKNCKARRKVTEDFHDELSSELDKLLRLGYHALIERSAGIGAKVKQWARSKDLEVRTINGAELIEGDDIEDLVNGADVVLLNGADKLPKTRYGQLLNVLSDKSPFVVMFVEDARNLPNAVRTRARLIKGERKVTEDFQNATIETNKEKITIKSEPKDSDFGDDEMIAPLSDETFAEIEENNNEIPEFSEDEMDIPSEDNYEDIDITDLDEEEFDSLGESFLKKVYNNVRAYKTTSGSINGDKLKLEGVITFKSGKKVNTSFVFESKTVSKTGKLVFEGLNSQFAKKKNAFTLTGKVNKGKLKVESLKYNYSAKDLDTGKSKKIYGSVKK